MEEAGYPGGEGYPTLTLITQNDQEKKDVAQAMQAMWKENLGVNVEIVTFEPKVYWDEQTAGNFDICYDAGPAIILTPAPIWTASFSREMKPSAAGSTTRPRNTTA